MRKAARACGIAAVLALAGCKAELYRALPEQEANEMIALLMRSGIQADKVIAKDGTDSIEVDKARFGEAVTLLHDAGYPRKQFETMGEVFRSSGLVASPLQERARFLYALSQELSATISQIDGVISARVSVVLPQNDILDRSPTPSSASVFVKYDSRFDVGKLVPQIKMLVADSVQGLGYDKVSVIEVPVAPPLPVSAPPAPVSTLAYAEAAIGGFLVATSLAAAAWLARARLTRLVSLLPGRRKADVAAGRDILPQGRG